MTAKKLIVGSEFYREQQALLSYRQFLLLLDHLLANLLLNRPKEKARLWKHKCNECRDCYYSFSCCLRTSYESTNRIIRSTSYYWFKHNVRTKLRRITNSASITIARYWELVLTRNCNRLKVLTSPTKKLLFSLIAF